MKRDWTIIISESETGEVTIRTEPSISKADIANHIAQLKVNGKGYGAAFDYVINLRNYATEVSRGKMLREKGDKKRDGRLIITRGD